MLTVVFQPVAIKQLSAGSPSFILPTVPQGQQDEPHFTDKETVTQKWPKLFTAPQVQYC